MCTWSTKSSKGCKEACNIHLDNKKIWSVFGFLGLFLSLLFSNGLVRVMYVLWRCQLAVNADDPHLYTIVLLIVMKMTSVIETMIFPQWLIIWIVKCLAIVHLMMILKRFVLSLYFLLCCFIPPADGADHFFYVRFCLVSYNASRAVVQSYFVSWLPHTHFLRLAFSRNRDMDQWEEMTRSVSFHVILPGLLYYSSLRFVWHCWSCCFYIVYHWYIRDEPLWECYEFPRASHCFGVQDIFFDDESPEMIISSLRLGEEQHRYSQ